MGENLKIFIAFAVFGLALAELKIEGDYNAGVIKVNCSWKIEAAPYASKIHIMRNDEKITCKDGVNTATALDEVNCTCNKLTDKLAMCSIVANAPANATDEVYRAITCLGENCTPEVAEVDVYVPATQLGKIMSTKKDSGEHEIDCIFRGVPAPQITWKIIKNNEIRQVIGKFIKTTSTWDATSKVWETRSTFKAKTEQKTVMCLAQQKMKTGNLVASLTDTVPINSAGKIGTSGVYVVLSLVYAFISKSLV